MLHIYDHNFKEIFWSQIVSVLGGLLAGTVLAIYIEQLLLIPSMFVLLPGFLEMRASISAPLASRLSSGLFLGVIPLKKKSKTKTQIIRGNLLASFFLSIMTAFLLGTIVFLMNYFVFEVYTPRLLFVVLLAGVLANAIEIPLTFFTTFYLFKKGHDPNNIMGPFITSLGDITSIVSLLIALMLMME